MFCRKCGKESKENNKFCEYCGNKLENNYVGNSINGISNINNMKVEKKVPIFH